MQSADSASVVLREKIGADAPARILYRPDIDGLRAISVLAVIFFHAKVPGFAGGYVGVDVFFVISGYLITQILMTSRQRSIGDRLLEFYVRRCRRILPALLVMLLATLPVACWLFLPGDLTRFGTVIAATSVFAGNLVAWRTGGYFELQTPFNPLAHLWSLAVEEQFYLVFPLVFLSLEKTRHGRLLLALCALASFALCVWASSEHPRANFFLAPTRAWELLLGSLVALRVGRSLSTHPLRGLIAVLSLAALVVCVIAYSGRLRYPGLYALVPCMSAALLLATESGSRSSRIGAWLSTRALVFVGVISYSLYLWHVPVLAFAAYYNMLPLEPLQLSVLLVAIFVLATATWRYVEAPVRRQAVLASGTRFLAVAAAGTLVAGALGVLLWRSGGLPGRLDAADAKLLDTVDRLQSDEIGCSRSARDVASGSLCAFGPASAAKADVVVWGDSHAIALFPAYEQIATARNVRVHAAVLPACRPLLAVGNNKLERPVCDDFNAAVVEAIEKIDPVLVILNAYWGYSGLRIDAPGGAADELDVHAFEAGFDDTLRAIAARRKICVIGDVPALKYAMPSAYVLARKRGLDPNSIALPSAEAKGQLGDVDAYFERLAQRRRLAFVDLKTSLCAGATCALIGSDGRSLYRDNNHLSVAGAQFLRPSVESCFDGIE